jgi:hypothetical protein
LHDDSSSHVTVSWPLQDPGANVMILNIFSQEKSDSWSQCYDFGKTGKIREKCGF